MIKVLDYRPASITNEFAFFFEALFPISLYPSETSHFDAEVNSTIQFSQNVFERPKPLFFRSCDMGVHITTTLDNLIGW